MVQIVELDPNKCISRNNTRDAESEHDVADLVSSIANEGQIQPISVKAIGEGPRPGYYEIEYGHRRTEACRRLGILVKATISELGNSEEDRARSYLRTMLENNTRRDTNPMEDARAYDRALDEFGLSIEDLQESLGLRRDVLDRRLDLLKLNEDIQKLVADGQLGVTYASYMAPLNSAYQQVAMRAFNSNPSPTTKWFAGVCSKCLADQSQTGFNFGAMGLDPGQKTQLLDDLEIQLRMPPDPAEFVPAYNPLDMVGSIRGMLAEWQEVPDKWAAYGKGSKATHAQGIVNMLRAQLEALGEQSEQVESEADRIYRLLDDRGELTTKRIMQYGNMASAELAPVLDDLVSSGKVARRRSGRGFRYAIAA